MTQRNVRLGMGLLFLAAGLAAAALPTAARAEDGKETFTAQKCNTCHSIASAGIAATTKSEKIKGPDLGGVVAEKGADWAFKFLRKQVELDGKKHGKDIKLSDDELKSLIAWLATQKKA